jgi:hypothetical protein
MALKVRLLDECVSDMHGGRESSFDWSNAITNTRIQSLTILPNIYFNNIII